MTKQRKVVGTGITARTVTMYSPDDPDLPTALRTSAQSWNASLKRGGFFGAVTSGMVEQMEVILAEADGNMPAEDEDTPEDFACRIIRLHGIVAIHIAKKNADQAARYAFELGSLYSKAVMKWKWEQHALRGKTVKESASRGGEQRWRTAGFKEKASMLQATRDRIRRENPKWNEGRVKKAAAKAERCSVRTIDRYT